MKREEPTAIVESENECDHHHYNYRIFELWHKFTTKLCPPGCMRFLVRFALLGAILLLFILALALQQNSFIKSNKSTSNESQEKQIKLPASKETGPSTEEKEIRRLLLRAADIAPDEGIVVPPAISGSNGGTVNNQQQLEMAVGAGLLFPIGRYPQGGKPGGVSPLTLNVAVVLVVSLLSIAVLITAICCVIIIALAMDSATNIDSIMPGGGGSSHSADFLLSNWPNLMLNGPDIGGSSVHFDKFLATRSAHYNMTPPLTDDEEDDEEETTALMMDVEDLESGIARGNCAFSQQNFNDRERLIFLDETENIEGSWPAKI